METIMETIYGGITGYILFKLYRTIKRKNRERKFYKEMQQHFKNWKT